MVIAIAEVDSYDIESDAMNIPLQDAAAPSLTGRLTLVTGGGSGLGAALCTTLARAGATVVVADLNAQRAQSIVRQLAERGFQGHACQFDVSIEAQVGARLDEIQARLGSLDILINNAGVDHTRPLDELSVAQWDQVIGTNLRGPFLLCQRAALQMKPRGAGHIINICSTAAKRAWPNACAYHASKWGLLGLSHALHSELRVFGIKVTAVIAGGMRTPFLLERFPGLDAATLQEPTVVAQAVLGVLALPPQSVVAEISVLPMGETSWP